jgi:hypothetical protein
MQDCHGEQSSQPKSQPVTQVILEIDRCYQHHQQTKAKKETCPTGKYKDTALIERNFSGRWNTPVNPLAKPGPQLCSNAPLISDRG